jgi:hypothetical protein
VRVLLIPLPVLLFGFALRLPGRCLLCLACCGLRRRVVLLHLQAARLRLPPLILNRRTSRLRRLSALGGGDIGRARRGAPDIRLVCPPLCGCRHPFLLLHFMSGLRLLNARTLRGFSPELFPHYGVMRLVMIVVLLQLMLLLDLLGVLTSRILPLVVG